MNSYEMTFIVRPDRDEEQTHAIVQAVTGRIEAAGGEVIATSPWNPPRRRMAYPIKEFSDGYYVVTVFRLDGQAVRGVENALKLNDDVLRFLVMRASQQNIEQVQQRAQQAYMAASQPSQPAAAADEEGPALSVEEQPAIEASESPIDEPVESEEPAATAASGSSQE